MKKFRFKFDSVLKVRKSEEESALRALGAAQRAHQEELRKKEKVAKDLSNALLRRENLGTESTRTPIDILPFRMENEFITGLKQRLIQADHAIMRASRGVEKALRAFLIARRKTRMMETLYERDLAEFRRERAKYEQHQLDDLNIMRARFKEKVA